MENVILFSLLRIVQLYLQVLDQLNQEDYKVTATAVCKNIFYLIVSATGPIVTNNLAQGTDINTALIKDIEQ